ncbi:hypothetical protein L6452_42322 [Arctium lappa]|uniref:Uncharacterized protein n=1 Tax=Arctium lappa TaxID=4217 RepID=A0ACB8XI60_ARCLA|nr:hypothetical protein L6452_42322 [Arctium lappa]
MLEKTSSESGGVICFSQISNSALAGDDNNQTPEDSDVLENRRSGSILGTGYSVFVVGASLNASDGIVKRDDEFMIPDR